MGEAGVQKIGASLSEGIPAQVRAGNPPLPPVLLLAWPKPACQSNLGG